jgi:peptidoglycan hydrolase CwlO-like protein
MEIKLNLNSLFIKHLSKIIIVVLIIINGYFLFNRVNKAQLLKLQGQLVEKNNELEDINAELLQMSGELKESREKLAKAEKRAATIDKEIKSINTNGNINDAIGLFLSD